MIEVVDCEAPIHEAEEAAIVNAVAVRRREFSAGRRAARRALHVLGTPCTALPQGADRLPIWPGGIVGSISHCRHLACAVVARHATSVGVDLECEGRLPKETYSAVFTPAEMERLGQISDPTLAFSAKEAVFKALFPVIRTYLEFHELEVAFESSEGRFKVIGPSNGGLSALAGRIEGYFQEADGHVFTLAFLGGLPIPQLPRT